MLAPVTGATLAGPFDLPSGAVARLPHDQDLDPWNVLYWRGGNPPGFARDLQTCFDLISAADLKPLSLRERGWGEGTA